MCITDSSNQSAQSLLSNVHCQISLAAGHRPYSSALKSHPIYKTGFSDTNWDNHQSSAGVFAVAQAWHKYQQDPSKGFVVEKKLINSLPILFEYKSYLFHRFHRETMGAVMFCKDVALFDHPDLCALSPTYGLETKYINKRTRSISRSTSGLRKDYHVGEKASIIVTQTPDNIQHAARKIHNDLLKVDLNGNSRPYMKQLALMVTARKKYFQSDSVVYDQIITTIKEEIELKKRRTMHKLEHETFSKYLVKIEEYAEDDSNYVTLDDGRMVFVIPSKDRDTYVYLLMLRGRNDDDWRLMFLKEIGIDMDGYDDASQKKRSCNQGEESQYENNDGETAEETETDEEDFI